MASLPRALNKVEVQDLLIKFQSVRNIKLEDRNTPRRRRGRHLGGHCGEGNKHPQDRAEVDWIIGYHLEVVNFTRGINEPKRT